MLKDLANSNYIEKLNTKHVCCKTCETPIDMMSTPKYNYMLDEELDGPIATLDLFYCPNCNIKGYVDNVKIALNNSEFIHLDKYIEKFSLDNELNEVSLEKLIDDICLNSIKRIPKDYYHNKDIIQKIINETSYKDFKHELIEDEDNLRFILPKKYTDDIEGYSYYTEIEVPIMESVVRLKIIGTIPKENEYFYALAMEPSFTKIQKVHSNGQYRYKINNIEFIEDNSKFKVEIESNYGDIEALKVGDIESVVIIAYYYVNKYYQCSLPSNGSEEDFEKKIEVFDKYSELHDYIIAFNNYVRGVVFEEDNEFSNMPIEYKSKKYKENKLDYNIHLRLSNIKDNRERFGVKINNKTNIVISYFDKKEHSHFTADIKINDQIVETMRFREAKEVLDMILMFKKALNSGIKAKKAELDNSFDKDDNRFDKYYEGIVDKIEISHQLNDEKDFFLDLFRDIDKYNYYNDNKLLYRFEYKGNSLINTAACEMEGFDCEYNVKPSQGKYKYIVNKLNDSYNKYYVNDFKELIEAMQDISKSSI